MAIESEAEACVERAKFEIECARMHLEAAMSNLADALHPKTRGSERWTEAGRVAFRAKRLQLLDFAVKLEMTDFDIGPRATTGVPTGACTCPSTPSEAPNG